MSNFVGYKVSFSSRALKSFEKLPRHIQNLILKKITLLTSSLEPNADIKKLEGKHSFLRMRVGDYRIVFEPIHHEIIIHIILVAHRKDIYQELQKLLR